MLKPLVSLSLALSLGGCTFLSPDGSREFLKDDLQLFAYDLGATHAGLARCGLGHNELRAHLESAQIALKGQAGLRLPVLLPAFEKGLQESAGVGQRLHIPCDCAVELVKESRLHNLSLYRAVSLPKALAGGATQYYLKD
jgi:hypothetical protein